MLDTILKVWGVSAGMGKDSLKKCVLPNFCVQDTLVGTVGIIN